MYLCWAQHFEPIKNNIQEKEDTDKEELNYSEIEQTSGGINISGYEGAGAVMAVVGFGSLFTPIGIITGGIAIGAAGGLALSQLIADYKLR
ncbi:hypothetical protein [Alteromonas lipotrueiana]|uniref:hypothetical protein n=1 Tax=Alteromonas lipotrueiana TaxID=2803815 RepID=UPI001C43FB65|nr:hypothetical protein [Alteromonas lipotrueiana]